MITYAIEPQITPAPPILNNPVAITTQKRLTGSGSGVFSNRTSTVKTPYVAKDGADIPLIDISDHNIDGCAGLFRGQNGHVGLLSTKRISLQNGAYAPGVSCGVVLGSGTHFDEIVMEDCDYSRSEYITAPGDIYAGLLTGGGHDSAGNAYGSCKKTTIRNCRALNAFTNYPAGETSYPNSDIVAVETTYTNGLIDGCYFRGAADAIFDCKGVGWRVQNSIFEAARELFKTWISREDGDVYCRFPRFAHWLITHMGQSDVRTEHTVDFAEVVGTDPNIPVVKFERFPGILRLRNYLFNLPEGQVLARADREAFGSQVIIGDRIITVDKPIVML